MKMREILRNFASSLSRIEKIKLKTTFSLLLLALLANPSMMLISAVTATGAPSETVAIINAVDGTSIFNFTTAQQNVGDTFVINVTITGALDIFSWQVTIQWDGSLLNFVAMTLPSDNIFADLNPIVPPVINSTPGSVLMGASAMGQTGFSGSGTMAQLTLEIIKAPVSGPSVQTDINFEGVGTDTFLEDSNLADVSANYAWNWAHYEYSLYGYSGPPGPTLVDGVAVTSVAPMYWSMLSPIVGSGSSVGVSVTVLNTGDFTENVGVAIFVNSTSAAPTQTVASLGPGLSSTLIFSWNTTGWAMGDYVLSATASLLGDPTPVDNTLIYSQGLIHLIYGAPSGGSVWVITSEPAYELNTTLFPAPSVVYSTSIGQNFTVSINISDVYNLGEWSVGVAFNSSILNLTGLYEGDFMKSATTIFTKTTSADTFLTPSESMPVASDSIVGPLRINGSGQLAYLTFTSVGIGVSNIQLVDASLNDLDVNAGPAFIPFEIIEHFAVPFNGTIIEQSTAYLVETANATATSGLFNTTFSPQDKEISFDVLATKNWSLQVSVPKNLLTCSKTSQWTIKVDGTPIPYTATETDTATELSFQPNEGNHTVEIIGTSIPGDMQNPSPTQSLTPPSLLVAIAASLSIATLLVALIDLKKTRSFRALKEFIHAPLKYIQQNITRNHEKFLKANTQ